MLPAMAAIKAGRQALKAWKALPDSKREALAGDAATVTRLVAELAGESVSAAQGRVVGRASAPSVTAKRDRQVVLAELTAATQNLSRNAAPEVVAFAADRSRTVKYGGKAVGVLLKANARRGDERAIEPGGSEVAGLLAGARPGEEETARR
jgi:hypothetical protein